MQLINNWKPVQKFYNFLKKKKKKKATLENVMQIWATELLNSLISDSKSGHQESVKVIK
jgi:20S proteasome alpha/beta subunit